MSIRVKLTVMFLFFLLVPSLIAGVLTFTNYKKSLETLRLSALQDVAAFKADRIDAYFSGLKTAIETAQGYFNIKQNLPVLTRLAKAPNAPEFLSARKMLDTQLQHVQSVLVLSDIMLVNPMGEIVYSSNPEHNPKDFLNPLNDPQKQAFAEGKNKVHVSDIFLDKAKGNKPSMLVTAPAVGFDGAFIGVIAFEIDMSSIYKIIQEVTGLGDTGEVLLGKKTGNEVIFLNPLRHDPEAAFRKSLTFGGELGGPVQEAVQGRQGSGRLIDYRGKDVIAAWRYIPSLDWGMVAKIDAGEAFADVLKVRNLVVTILTIICTLCGIIAFLVARSISEPIKNLTRGAEIVGSGNLDYRVETHLNDEIGQLSRTFDKMTRDLKRITASRDELNREIVERKQAEENLQKALSELERSNRELEQFAYVASHDLQEPLRMVASYVRLLEKKYRGQLDDKADQYIHFAVDGALRMQKLIEGLLAYARIGRGGEFTLVNTSDVVSQVVSDLSESLQESRAVITKDDLPTVTGDETLLMQLFQNLIRNAVKFRKPEVPPQVHVSARKEGREWVFSVRDNGIGIDPTYADRIFLIFQRLHTREEYPGTGIGLALCKKIVERHHGRIWVESAPGEGATFFFAIPV